MGDRLIDLRPRRKQKDFLLTEENSHGISFRVPFHFRAPNFFVLIDQKFLLMRTIKRPYDFAKPRDLAIVVLSLQNSSLLPTF